MKNFEEWNEIKIETDGKKSVIKIKEGEIRWCRIGINIGDETFGKGKDFIRPVLILKKFSGNVFLGVPLTSKIHKGSWFYVLSNNGIERSAILNQARLFDRKRLQEKIFQIYDSELLKIKQAYCNLILP